MTDQAGRDAGVVVLDRDGAVIRLTELGDGRRRVTVEPGDPADFVSRRSCETRYPVDLIERLPEVKGPNSLRDEILRDEDETYVALELRYAFLGYLAPEELAGRRLLDFGCGSAGSTLVLARLLPETEIVGVDFQSRFIDLARYRAERLGVPVRFELSPSPESLPSELDTFDFVALCAVYEHLLPSERPALLGQLWALLRPGGVLFVNGTPNRYYPLEFHTTGLPLLNYLTDRAAHSIARRHSRKWCRGASWEEMLRRGVRGATRSEILGLLAREGAKAELLRPMRLGCRDEVDLWYAVSTARNPRAFKPALRLAFKSFARLTGRLPVPDLELAIRKQG